MHGEDGAGSGNQEQLDRAYQRMHRKSRQEHGALEFYLLKAVARLLVR